MPPTRPDRLSRLFPSLALALVATLATLAPREAARAQSSASTSAAPADSLFARGDYAAAAVAYRKIVDEQPSSGRAWMRLGFARAQLGDHAAAADAFEHAVALGPTAVALYNAARERVRLGQTDRGLALLQRAGATGAIPPDFLSRDTALAALRGDRRFRAALDSAARASTPCAADRDARRFDFWVGEWDVRTPQGQTAGSSSVLPVSGQCALLENWTSAFGTSGKSLNGYNRALGHWQQFWIGQDGSVTEYRESSWDGPSLVFLAPAAPGDTTHTERRLTFTPLSKDLVRQHGETSSDQGRSWRTSYDLYYHRKR